MWRKPLTWSAASRALIEEVIAESLMTTVGSERSISEARSAMAISGTSPTNEQATTQESATLVFIFVSSVLQTPDSRIGERPAPCDGAPSLAFAAKTQIL